MHGPAVGLTGPPGNRFDYLFHGELGIDPKITLHFLFLFFFSSFGGDISERQFSDILRLNSGNLCTSFFLFLVL